MMESPEIHVSHKRRWGRVGGAALVMLAIGYSGFWLYTADHIMAYMEKWAGSSDGNAHWQSMSATGFPFHLSITLERPLVSDRHGNQWSTNQAVIHMLPWDWTTFTLNAPHTQEIHVTGGKTVSAFQLDSDRLEGVFSVQNAQIYTASITGTNARLRDDKDQTLTVADVKIDAEAIPHLPADLTRRSGMLWFSLSGIQSASFAALSLGERLEKATGEIELFGPLPVPLKTAQLARWRDAGGIAEIRSLRVVYGPLNLHTEGTVALDADLQPVGAFTARIRGFHETVDALRDAGVIGGGEALTAKLVLGALAQTDSGTGLSTLNLPISIQNRRFYAGPLKLGKIPLVNWAE